MRGTVKFFNSQRGYGFITPDGGGQDIFVHVTALKATGLEELVENDKVEFETKPSERKPNKGPTAINVRVVS